MREKYWRQDYEQEVAEELFRSDKIHPGCEDLPDGTWAGGGRVTQRTIAQNSCDRARREDRLTYAHILEEEVCEALAEEDVVKLRKELIQVGAVVAKWVRAIDRRAK